MYNYNLIIMEIMNYKKFGTIVLAAILGSAISLGVYKLTEDNKKETIRIEHSSQTPIVGATYTVNKDGKMVPLEFTKIAKKVMPGVVHIKSTQLQRANSNQYRQQNSPFHEFFEDDIFRHFFGPNTRPNNSGRTQQPQARVGTGSGVIINEHGFIVTNNHVIQDADDIEVTLNDNRVFKAKVIGTDPSTDLALIQIKADNLSYIPLSNSDNVEVGEWVLAIGNPFNLTSTVTAGIVSAKARNINILQDRSAIESFIQTDAAINPGNSGGALVDLKGTLIGINTAIASPTGAYTGYGFAVPSNIVNKAIGDLKKYGMVQRGYLGLMIRNVDGSLAKEKDLDLTEGVYVDSIPNNSAAGSAGIKEGDIIIQINKNKIKSSAELMEHVGRHHPGDKLEITVDRDGKTKSFSVILRNKLGKEKIQESNNQDILSKLGIEIENIDSNLSKKLGINYGVIVKNILPGKISRETDMRKGFIITKVNTKEIKSPEDLVKYLSSQKGGVMIEGTYPNYPGVLYYAFGL
ncbi:MAG: Do family serine endopeptidase [Marinifilaceae bacterium]|jgi:Do/DeqQ family serine protease|nr:Do family serine endopeptidase [Marinifilaceae bacterium]